MKTQIFRLLITCVLGIGLLLGSCSKDAPSLNQLNHKVYEGFTPLLDKIHTLKSDMDPEHVVYIEVSWKKETNEARINSIEQKEPDFIPIPLKVKNKGAEDSGGPGEKDAYQVDCCCNDQGHDIWNKTCDGKWSCGTLVADCLEEGGCATMCNATIIYMPQNSAYLVNLPPANAGSTSP